MGFAAVPVSVLPVMESVQPVEAPRPALMSSFQTEGSVQML